MNNEEKLEPIDFDLCMDVAVAAFDSVYDHEEPNYNPSVGALMLFKMTASVLLDSGLGIGELLRQVLDCEDDLNDMDRVCECENCSNCSCEDCQSDDLKDVPTSGSVN